jgi:nucleotide-binding universal stress UspA family protein
MVTFTHVLCPIDFSEPSRRALTYARSFAEWHHARLTVMHVAPSFEPTLVTPARSEATGEVVYPVTREDVLEALRREAGSARTSSHLEVEVVAESGSAVSQILDRAVTWPADLVVIGTHGLSGFDRLLLGSVAERVMHKSPCPVLTVPPAAHAVSPARIAIQRILCAVDFAPSSQVAVGFALDLARQVGGAVTLLHVVESPDDGEPRTDAHVDIPEHLRQPMADARERLQALAPRREAGQDVSHVVAHGRPKSQILAHATDAGADLIVMGAQGREGIGLALLGSTTERVVRDAACPVLTVRGVPIRPS